MPTYEYRCDSCGRQITMVVRMRDHKNTALCQCGELAQQVINQAPTLVIPEHMRWNAQAYVSPTTGAVITNKQQRINDMAASGCIEYEPGMRQDYDRRCVESDIALDKAVEETVAREIEAMPAEKKEALGVAVENFSAEPVRLSL